MAKPTKVTYTLDEATVERIERTAARLGMPKSGVVREAVAEYAARADKLSEAERLRTLSEFDRLVAEIPLRPARTADAELAALRRARHSGGRRTPSE